MSPTAPRSISIPRRLATALLKEAESRTEICGFIAPGHATGGPTFTRYALPNRAARPASRFAMDPAEQLMAIRRMRAAGERLIAIYHSHPGGEASPSIRDTQEHYYPQAAALLLAAVARAQRIRAWRMDAREPREIAIIRVDATWHDGFL